MNSRVQNLLSSFILLALVVIVSLDRFGTPTDLGQLVSGVLVGLTIAASLVYIALISRTRS